MGSEMCIRDRPHGGSTITAVRAPGPPQTLKPRRTDTNIGGRSSGRCNTTRRQRDAGRTIYPWSALLGRFERRGCTVSVESLALNNSPARGRNSSRDITVAMASSYSHSMALAIPQVGDAAQAEPNQHPLEIAVTARRSTSRPVWALGQLSTAGASPTIDLPQGKSQQSHTQSPSGRKSGALVRHAYSAALAACAERRVTARTGGEIAAGDGS